VDVAIGKAFVERFALGFSDRASKPVGEAQLSLSWNPRDLCAAPTDICLLCTNRPMCGHPPTAESDPTATLAAPAAMVLMPVSAPIKVLVWTDTMPPP